MSLEDVHKISRILSHDMIYSNIAENVHKVRRNRFYEFQDQFKFSVGETFKYLITKDVSPRMLYGTILSALR